MKILIAGSNGQIGSFISNKLKHLFDLTHISFSDNFKKENFHVLDLTSINSVKNFSKSSKKFEVLIFLVGLAHSKGKRKNRELFEKINYTTLVNLLNTFESENKTIIVVKMTRKP